MMVETERERVVLSQLVRVCGDRYVVGWLFKIIEADQL